MKPVETPISNPSETTTQAGAAGMPDQNVNRREFFNILGKVAAVGAAGAAGLKCAGEQEPQPESLFGGAVDNQIVQAESVEVPCGDSLSVTASPNFSTQTEWFVYGSDDLAGSENVPAWGHLRLTVPSGCPLVVRMASEYDTEIVFSFEGVVMINEKPHSGEVLLTIPKGKESSFVFRHPTAEEKAAFEAANTSEPQAPPQ